MKRLIIVLVGVIAFSFGATILLDVVNLSTARAEKWAVIFAFAGVMFSIGVLSASKESGSRAASVPADDVALERSLRFVPSAPGSLRSTSRRRAVDTDAHDTDAHDTDHVVAAPVIDAPFIDLDAILDDEPAPIIRAAPIAELILEPCTVQVEPELETTELETTELETTELETTAAATIEPVVALPIAGPSINLDSYSDVDLITTVKKGERSVIHEMMARGQLTNSGPLSEKDIAMMIFLSCTSDDLLADLQERKATAQPVPSRAAHSFAAG